MGVLFPLNALIFHRRKSWLRLVVCGVRSGYRQAYSRVLKRYPKMDLLGDVSGGFF